MRYSIAENLKIKNAGEEILVYDQNRKVMHVLNETALFVLQSVTEKSVDQVKSELIENYGADREEVVKDIQEIIEEFLCKGILLDTAC